jgi:hypothetical protein
LRESEDAARRERKGAWRFVGQERDAWFCSSIAHALTGFPPNLLPESFFAEQKIFKFEGGIAEL